MAIKPLTSAFIRLRNEAEWLPYCLESIENAFDEIVLFTQGEQTDGTDDICAESGHTWYLFPHLSYPNGPGHDRYPDDHKARSYFYNWCLDRINGDYAVKWDGDMIAHDWFGDRLRDILRGNPPAVKFHGVDVVGDVNHVGTRRYCAAEWRVFKRTAGRYRTGPYCEVLDAPTTGGYVITEPAFIHAKWAKANPREAWPDNWREIPHFQGINDRSRQATRYDGELPACLIRTTSF